MSDVRFLVCDCSSLKSRTASLAEHGRPAVGVNFFLQRKSDAGSQVRDVDLVSLSTLVSARSDRIARRNIDGVRKARRVDDANRKAVRAEVKARPNFPRGVREIQPEQHQ